MSMKENFLHEFRRLEKFLQIKSTTKEVEYFKQHIRSSDNKVIRNSHNQHFLLLAADLRNILTHNADDVALPTKDFLDKFTKLVDNILAPPKVTKVMVKKSNILSFDIHHKISDASKIMKEKKISNVLIFENNDLVGIFNESTLFNYYLNKDIVLEHSESTFQEIKEALKIEEHPSVYYRYVKSSLNIYKAQNIFDKEQFLNDKRLELLLVTSTGKPKEEIQGIVSPYDLIKYNNSQDII